MNLGEGPIQIRSPDLNRKLIGGKPGLAFPAHVFRDPLAWDSEEAEKPPGLKAPSAQVASAFLGQWSLPLTRLSRSLLVSDLMNLKEMKLKKSPLLHCWVFKCSCFSSPRGDWFSLGSGHLPVSTAGPCELVLKKTSQKRPHTGPWQKRLCNGPNPDVNVVRSPV